jgi:hypothetical protein
MRGPRTVISSLPDLTHDINKKQLPFSSMDGCNCTTSFSVFLAHTRDEGPVFRQPADSPTAMAGSDGCSP